jgi:hypothetical protein
MMILFFFIDISSMSTRKTKEKENATITPILERPPLLDR